MKEKVYIQQKFYDILNSKKAEKELSGNSANSCRLLAFGEYENLIAEIEKVSNKTGTKNNKEYNLINSYKVLIIGDECNKQYNHRTDI